MYTYSDEHIAYLKKIKKKRVIITFFRIIISVAFLLTWEVLSKNNFINPFFYSSPSHIFLTIISLFKREHLLLHIGITLNEVFISFSITMILGLFIAFFLWRYEILSDIIDPYLTVLNSLPKVSLGPLIIIWIGASTKSIIFMALTISLFTVIINIYQGFISVNSNHILMIQSFGASKYQVFRKVVLPSNYYNILSTLKINISLSFIGVIMGELLVSKKGLGYLIMYGSQVFQLDLVITCIFLLGILSYFLYYLVDLLLKIVDKKEIN